MVKLSGLDTAFLALESERWPAHVVCLTVVDASGTGGRVDHDAFRRGLAARLPRLPLLTRRLVTGPLGLTRPRWVEDPDFDLDDHLHRATLAGGGGRAELAAMAAEIYRAPLPRDRPLWEWWVVEGLEGGRVAHLWKVHHACVDGRSGAAMQEVFFDRDPDGTVRPLPLDQAAAERPAAGGPGAGAGPGRWAGAVLDLAEVPVRAGRRAAGLAQGLVEAARSGALGRALPLPAPRVRFNEPVGRDRAYGFCSVSLSDVKAVKNAFGVTVNDVVLAICAGALREHLLAAGELPDRQLVTTVPVDATRGGARAGGNAISGMLVGLATDVADPAERLLRIHANAVAAKALHAATGGDLLGGLAEVPPPALLGVLGRLYRGARLASALPPLCNTVISNVPGPRTPLYALGQKVEAFHSMGIIADGFGLFIGGLSYDDQIDVGVMADRRALPDPFALADSIVDQLNVLLKAAHEADGRRVLDELDPEPLPDEAPRPAARAADEPPHLPAPACSPVDGTGPAADETDPAGAPAPHASPRAAAVPPAGEPVAGTDSPGAGPGRQAGPVRDTDRRGREAVRAPGEAGTAPPRRRPPARVAPAAGGGRR